MKKFSTAKLHNSLRYITFILVISPSEIIPYHYTIKLHNLLVTIEHIWFPFVLIL